MDILERDPNTDNLALLMWLWGPRLDLENLRSEVPALIDIRRRTSKPMVVALAHFDAPKDKELASKIASDFHKGGVPSFPTAERAARALKHSLDYYARHNAP